MLDVLTLHHYGSSLEIIARDKNIEGCEDLTYNSGPASFHDLTTGGPQCSVSSSHADAVREHCNTDKGIAIAMLPKGGVLIFIRLRPVQNGDCLVVDGDTDNSNLVVYGRDQFNASTFRYISQDFGAVPGIVSKRGSPIKNTFR